MRSFVLRALVRIRRRVPPGLRLPLGLLLMVGGVLGMLPVLGFWMLPLGVAVAALDIKPLLGGIRRRWPGASLDRAGRGAQCRDPDERTAP